MLGTEPKIDMHVCNKQVKLMVGGYERLARVNKCRQQDFIWFGKLHYVQYVRISKGTTELLTFR